MPPKPKIRLFYYLKYSWYVGALLIFLASFSPSFIEVYYTQGLFKQMTKGLRLASSSIPFALGEWVFLFIIIILIYNLLQFILQYKIQFKNSAFWKLVLGKLVFTFVKLYVVFQLIWGLNYHKTSPEKAFGLKLPTTYTPQELDHLSLELISAMNALRLQLPDSAIKNIKKPTLLTASVAHYKQAEGLRPYLSYAYPNIKFSTNPQLGDYLGYLAFYQPITGEAIVREDLPVLTLPFTISHEIAHQLGYASETEANFIAFVIGAETKEPLFKYSMLLQLFSYTQMEHLNLLAAKGNFRNWEAIVQRNKKLLSPAVLADRQQIKAFFNKRSHLLIPASVSLYDQFLQWNKQAKGIESYNEVVLWALAYKKKHPLLTE